MAFQVGNRLGQAPVKVKPWTKALSRFAKQNPDRLAKLAEATFNLADSGDVAAIREIGDRLDGKAKQSTEVTGANGSALFPVTHIAVTGVEPAAVVTAELERISEESDV